MKTTLTVGVALATVAAGSASADLIRADTAVASSEFSSAYVIGNAINGAGMPADFTADDAHADYSRNNHWTTRRDEAIGATATFRFDEAQDLQQFLLWNHRSNNIADDPGYAIRVFDLEFLDDIGAVISMVEGLAAERDVETAQVFTFDRVTSVSAVRLTVVENFGSRLTGLAEVAFTDVPSPASLAIAGVALLGVHRRRR